MRRLVFVVTGLTMAAILVPTAAAQVPTQDSVVGSGTFGFFPDSCCFPFEINVRSGPSGEQPSGQATFLLPFGGPPTCLAVDGRGGPGTSIAATNFVNPLTGSRVVIQVEEVEGVDTISFFTASSPSDCAFRGGPAAGVVIQPGQIVITDAPPSPTSREQCKNGGWRNFPGFRNQGACVSFVATGGRNPPPASG